MNETHETIAEEGGEAGKPAQAHQAEQRRWELLHEAIRYIPRRHRIGWYHALARRHNTPLTTTPTQAETDYLAWSHQRHTTPTTKRAKP
jgi:hypothetical protein